MALTALAGPGSSVVLQMVHDTGPPLFVSQNRELGKFAWGKLTVQHGNAR